MTKNFLRYTLVMVVILATMGLSSCKHLEPAMRIEHHSPERLIRNKSLVERRLKIIEPTIKEKVNGILKVQITALSIVNEKTQFEYRFRWLNSKGMEVKTPLATWTQISVSAKEEVFMSGIAPTEEVENFVFEVRFPFTSTRW